MLNNFFKLSLLSLATISTFAAVASQNNLRTDTQLNQQVLKAESPMTKTSTKRILGEYIVLFKSTTTTAEIDEIFRHINSKKSAKDNPLQRFSLIKGFAGTRYVHFVGRFQGMVLVP
jgi:hypothetical protein